VFKVPEITLEKYFLKNKNEEISFFWYHSDYKIDTNYAQTFINHYNDLSIVIRKTVHVEGSTHWWINVLTSDTSLFPVLPHLGAIHRQEGRNLWTNVS
jgi:autonomous glycyl radical cofactor GrcA